MTGTWRGTVRKGGAHPTVWIGELGKAFGPADLAPGVTAPVEGDRVIVTFVGRAETPVVMAGPYSTPPPSGPGGLTYRHLQVVADDVWTIPHHLGWDPAGFEVVDGTGALVLGFGIAYVTAGQVVALTFDGPISGTARVS